MSRRRPAHPQERNTRAILVALATTKDPKPDDISALSEEQLDWLLMYVYKGLGVVEDPGYDQAVTPQVMFKWFALIQKQGGDGCVMRAYSRRRAL